jgi:hypothetical protein
MNGLGNFEKAYLSSGPCHVVGGRSHVRPLPGSTFWRLFSTMTKSSRAGYRFSPEIDPAGDQLYRRFTLLKASESGC